MKKSLLTLFILPLALPICACNQEVEEVIPVRYEDGNNSVTIDDVPLDENGVLNIPSEVGGKPVVSIKAGAFENRKDIRKVVLPETIATIGSKAFAGCTNLKRMNIPESVKSVAFNCFEGDEAIELKVSHSYNEWKTIYTGSLDDNKVECASYTYNVMGKGARVVEYGGTVTLEAPEKKGHAFASWIVSEIDGEKSDTLTSASASFKFEYRKNIEIQAIYAVNAYSITLNSENGSPNKSVAVEYGAVPSNVEVPEKLGHKFLGYYLEAQKIDPPVPQVKTMVFNEFGVATMVFVKEENIQVYAHWEKQSFKASFDSKGGSTYGAKTVLFGEEFDLPYVSSNITGYIFNGWKCGEENLGYSTATYVWGEDVTIEAEWIASSYTITLYPGSGASLPDGAESVQHLKYGAKYELPVPTKEGYDFLGWKTSSSSQDYTKGVWHSTSISELYAYWQLHKYTITYSNVSTEKIKVTYDYSEISKQSVSEEFTYAQKIGLTPHYSDDNKMFEGWYTDSERTVRFSSSAVITENITLYSKWVDKPEASSYTSFIEINAFEHITAEDCLEIETGYAASELKPIIIAFRVNESSYHSVYRRKLNYTVSDYGMEIYDYTSDSVIASGTYTNYNWNSNTNYYYVNHIIFIKIYPDAGSTTVQLYFQNFKEPSSTKPYYGYEVENGVKSVKASIDDYYHLDKQYVSGKTFVGYFTEPDGAGTQLTDANGDSLAKWGVAEDKTVYPYFTEI